MMSVDGGPYSQCLQALSNRTRELSLLLAASHTFASSHTLPDLLEALCRTLLEAAQSTWCRVSILESDGKTLEVRAVRSIRALDWSLGLGRAFPLDALPKHRQAVISGEPTVLTAGSAEVELAEPERSMILGYQTRSALLLPLIGARQALGIATLGEMRIWERNPYSQEKVALCRAMAKQAGLAVENLQTFERMVRQNEEIRLIANSVADGILLTDLDGRIQFLNPAAERLLGCDFQAAIGRKCAQVLGRIADDGPTPCDPDCPLQDMTHLVPGAKAVQLKERIARPDGTKVLLSHRMNPVVDAQGRLTGVVTVLHDLSHEEEAVHLKSEFLALVSHELRAPLSNIAASADLLAQPALDPVLKTEMAKTLSKESSRLARMVDEMLEASRLEQGHIELALEPLALKPLIEQMVSSFRSRYPDYRFEMHLPEAPLFALGDLVSVQVILENLIRNATDYSRPGCPITITAAEQGDRVVVRVTDQGIGITPDELRRVFERFRRVPDNHGARTPGFGLGLYIARMLVEAQRGTIGAESKPGHGSCFYFDLEKLG
jgi:PAS domain S-box-containing protein